jgi:hypothetical protein
LLLALAVFVAVESPTADANSRSLPLNEYVGRLRTVDVVVNGQAARLIFDTGAGVSALTPAFAARAGCRASGRLVGHRMEGQQVVFQRCAAMQLSIGDRTIRRELAVLDLAGVLPEGLPPVDGVIGLDVFEGQRLTVGANLSWLDISRSRRVAPSGAHEGRMRIASEADGAGLTVFVAAETSTLDIWLLLDSANLSGVQVHTTALEMLDAVGGSVNLRVIGTPPTSVQARSSAQLIHDGALDADFLAGYEVTVDLGSERIWWRPILD